MKSHELEEEIILASFVDEPLPEHSSGPKKGLIEVLLSPQALQWMMSLGAGFLVIGFGIWLWTIGIFENPLVAAVSVGGVNLALIGCGIAMVKATRYQLAGRWLSLLGALAMPLNLWLYDSQGLITLADGGHLWIPAAICCFAYAGIARVLRDSAFVYTLVGGIVLTGMLFLADNNVGRFWELIPQVSFLLVVGWLSTFSNWLFPEGKGDFSRHYFGTAFQRSGNIVVGGGLVLLFAGQLSGFMAALLSFLPLPSVDLTRPQEFLSAGMIGISAILFAIQGSMAKKPSRYLVASGLLVWLIPLLMHLFNITLSISVLMLIVATGVVVLNLSSLLLGNGTTRSRTSVLVLSVIAVVGLTYLNSISFFGLNIGMETGYWAFLTQIATSLAAWAMAANLFSESTSESRVRGNLSLGVGAWTLALAVQSLGTFSNLSIEFFIVGPVVVSLLALLAGLALPNSRGKALGVAGSAFTAFHVLFSGIVLLQHGEIILSGQLIWAACLGIATFCFLAASSLHDGLYLNRMLACATSVGCLISLGDWLGLSAEYCLVLIPMISGTAIKVLAAFHNKHTYSGSTPPVESLANLLITGGAVGGVLMTGCRWLDDSITPWSLLVIGVLTGCTVLSTALTQSKTWQDAFRALIVALMAASICAFDGCFDFNGWHQAELCSLIAGALCLILGHTAWHREQKDQLRNDETATFGLLFGSLLTMAPLVLGLLAYRFGFASDEQWRLFHEIGALTCGLAFVGAGVLCRIRATTITGGILLAVWLLSLVSLLRLPEKLQSVSVMMMIGGGLFFATAILLSVYRERLVSLPGRIREGDGVYQVLKWR